MLPKIANLPHDNKIWVVSTYGGMVKSSNGGYLAELLMKEVTDGKVNLITKISRVPVRDLDFIKIGTVWKNKEFIKDVLEKWNEHEYYFDFHKYPPKIVPLIETKIYKSHEYDKLDSLTQEHFKNSNYLSLETVSGTTILIPVLEVLASIVLPDNKEIREKLLIKDINTVLKEYLIEGYSEDSKYIIRPHVVHFDRTLIFLAYLQNNEITKQRISKMLSSMLMTPLNPINNKPLTYKHPLILPFQPSHLTIQGKCTPIDNKTMLMYSVSGIADEADHDVLLKKIVNGEKNKTERKDRKYQYLSVQKEIEELDILHDGSPHYSNAHVAIRTRVKRINTQKSVLIEEERKRQEVVKREYVIGDNKTDLLSSADKNNKKDSEDTTQIKTSEEKEKSKLSVFKKAIIYIEQLKSHKKINDYCYISNEGKESKEEVYCECDLGKMEKKEKTWFRKKEKGGYNIRKFLIIKIEVHETLSRYILEIERIKQGEHYAGILFQTEDLNKELIQTLLQEIGKNKGRCTNKDESKKCLSIPYIFYTHKSGTNYICRILQKMLVDFSCTFKKKDEEEQNKQFG
jgi:hypothetical protein